MCHCSLCGDNPILDGQKNEFGDCENPYQCKKCCLRDECNERKVKEMNEKTLKLSKPIMINGSEFKELPYNFEDMTAKDKLNVGKRMKTDGMPVSVEEIDTDYHIYLFAGAVAKANSEIDIADILRISAKDAQKGAALARNFFYLDLGEQSKTQE